MESEISRRSRTSRPVRLASAAERSVAVASLAMRRAGWPSLRSLTITLEAGRRVLQRRLVRNRVVFVGGTDVRLQRDESRQNGQAAMNA